MSASSAMAAPADFLVERWPRTRQDRQQRHSALVAAGQLAELRDAGGRP